MTASAQASARPLLDLLGGRWRVGSAALAAAWDRGTGVAAFALADGTVALVHPVWDGGPAVRAWGSAVRVASGSPDRQRVALRVRRS